MCMNPRWLTVTKKDGSRRKMLVSCGSCFECMKGQAQKWALRCLSEARKHSDVCFVTLTYNEAHKPQSGSLRRSDLQNFIKRLRKNIYPAKVRYFYCGEYGSKGLRPHYHIMFFGWRPKDLYFWQMDGKNPLYRSPTVEKLWSVYSCNPDGSPHFDPIGYCSVGNITFDTAMYCAKYLQKIQDPPSGCIPAFTGMSRRPGLGIDLLSPQLLIDGGLYYYGRSISVPRYFVDKLSESHDLDEWKEKRYKASVHRYFCTDWRVRKEKFIKHSEMLLTKRKGCNIISLDKNDEVIDMHYYVRVVGGREREVDRRMIIPMICNYVFTYQGAADFIDKFSALDASGDSFLLEVGDLRIFKRGEGL